MDEATKAREAEISQVLEWLDRNGLDALNQKVLKDTVELSKKGDWKSVRENCWQVVKQVSSADPLINRKDHLNGMGRMYLGATYYADGDYWQAQEHFEQSRDAFEDHAHNQRVARFAIGLIYSHRGQEDSFNKCISGQDIEAIRSAGGGGVEDLWKSANQRLKTRGVKAAGVGKEADPEAWYNKLLGLNLVPRYTLGDVPEAPKTSIWQGVLEFAGLCVIIAAGALLTNVLTQNFSAVLAYLAAAIIATYVTLKRLQCPIPRDCAIVIETFEGKLDVKSRVGSYFRWPIFERLHATVPLYPMQYTSPKKSIKLGPEESVDIRLAAYYGVRFAGWDTNDILKAVCDVQSAITSQGADRGSSRQKSKPLSIEDVKQRWEKRLLSDIIMTLSEILPGWDHDSLSGKYAQQRLDLLARLGRRLADRAREWGMQIEEVTIVELAKNKS